MVQRVDQGRPRHEPPKREGGRSVTGARGRQRLRGLLVVAQMTLAMMLLVAAGLILASNIPLLRTPEFFIPKPFSYGRAIGRLFQKKHRRKFWAFVGFGEEFVALVLWPIFISTVIPNMFSLGVVMSLLCAAVGGADTLIVGDAVESTTGGFKFPDGTTRIREFRSMVQGLNQALAEIWIGGNRQTGLKLRNHRLCLFDNCQRFG